MLEFTITDNVPPKRKKKKKAAAPRKRVPKLPRILKVECANCGQTFIGKTAVSAYCSVGCREEAAFVRRLRKEIANGVDDPDVAPPTVIVALRTKLDWALKGGYSTPRREISAKTRAAVWKRDKGVCVLCGEEGAEIDHIFSGNDDPEFGSVESLRLLCVACHREVTDLNHNGGGKDD